MVIIIYVVAGLELNLALFFKNNSHKKICGQQSDDFYRRIFYFLRPRADQLLADNFSF